MSDPAASSHPGGKSQPVNPYSASLTPDGLSSPATSGQAAPFQYHLRITWADRRRFLRSVGPLRIYAVAGLVRGGWSLYELLRSLADMIKMQEDFSFTFVVQIALMLVRAAVALYICALTWRFADVLAAAVGGRNPEMEDWSSLQLRLAHLAVALFALSVASQAWDWLSIYWLFETAVSSES